MHTAEAGFRDFLKNITENCIQCSLLNLKLMYLCLSKDLKYFLNDSSIYL